MSLARLPRVPRYRVISDVSRSQWRPFLLKSLYPSRRSCFIPTAHRPKVAQPPQFALRAIANDNAIVHPGTWSSRRCVHVPNLLLPPVVFTGLLLGLWMWKCLMMVTFQNKIIYMPGLPPNARWERIADHAARCGGVQWREERTRAADGTDLAMAVTTVPLPGRPRAPRVEGVQPAVPAAHVYVLYFQGNASSIPPRLPDISWVLRAVSDSKAHNDLPPMQLTFVCLSYRGYWTSRGRPKEKGIKLDAEAGAWWIAQHHREMYGEQDPSTVPILLVWGQSIGSGVATNLAASESLPPDMPVRGLLLETPFLNVRAMLETLYPQKWLPYKYLWPFLRNQLDSWANFGVIAETAKAKGNARPAVFILEAARDELVPAEHGERLYHRCKDLGFDVERGAAPVAYHSEAIARGEGKRMAAEAILSLARRGGAKGG